MLWNIFRLDDTMSIIQCYAVIIYGYNSCPVRSVSTLTGDSLSSLPRFFRTYKQCYLSNLGVRLFRAT